MTDQISASLRAVLALRRCGFQAKHTLGQNFITDEDFLTHLIDLCGVDADDNVLEIGPGPGIMTSLLSDRCHSVTAIEADGRLEPVLKDVLEGKENASIVIGDALRVDIPAILRERIPDGNYRVIANLPYYITADLILRMLCVRPLPQSICVMVQKEAADRMMSRVGDKDWCALAAEVSYYADCTILEEVTPDHFDPQPHVMSCFLRLDIRPDRLVTPQDEAALMRLIRCCFHMRRKTLVNNLKAVYGLNQDDARNLLESIGLDSRVRGEALELEEIVRLFERMRHTDS